MRILLAEDDIQIAENIKSYLQKRGYVVDIAQSAEDAEFEISEETFDCVILDWMLPDGEGTQIASKFRSEGGQTPIIMLTAKSQI